MCRTRCYLYGAVDRAGDAVCDVVSGPLCAKCHRDCLAESRVLVNSVAIGRGAVRFVLPFATEGLEAASGSREVRMAVNANLASSDWRTRVARLERSDRFAHFARCRARQMQREMNAVWGDVHGWVPEDSDGWSSASSEISSDYVTTASEMSVGDVSDAEAERGSSESGVTEGEPATPQQMCDNDDHMRPGTSRESALDVEAEHTANETRVLHEELGLDWA